MSRALEHGRNEVDLTPLGDRAVLAHFDTERDAALWVAAVRRQAIRGITDVVLAYQSAAVFADPDVLDPDMLERELTTIEMRHEAVPESNILSIPVLYDGPDLEPVARRLGLAVQELVSLHSGAVYEVYAIGFLQGFPYAGYLPPALCGLPRREQPRLKVPAGSVAIAGRQTGIYPRESPGGWHLLGRTPLRIADADAGYFPIRAGDRIRFHAIDHAEFEARRDERL
ncbi:MAG: allophanate hydrolase subunit 1 [Isosphaeraceae bacterium]